jgi:CRP-like cAMP-binding protein
VARLGPGDFFGEMSLLTGAPRSASVTAVRDSEILEITAEAFRRFVLENPAIVEQVGAAVAERAARLDEHRAAGSSAAAPPETSERFFDRIRRFLRVSVN